MSGARKTQGQAPTHLGQKFFMVDLHPSPLFPSNPELWSEGSTLIAHFGWGGVLSSWELTQGALRYNTTTATVP